MRSALKAMYPVAGKRIVIIGCGHDRIADELASCHAEVIAFDICYKSVSFAAKQSRLVAYLQADSRLIPLRDFSADITLSVSTLQYVPSQPVIENCYRILRPGGTAVFVENLLGNPVARLNRIGRRLLGIPEPPNMHVLHHLALEDLALFGERFKTIEVRVWNDWNTVLYPFLQFEVPGSRFLRYLIRWSSQPMRPTEARARFGWVAEIVARKDRL